MDARVELIDGAIIDMTPIGSEHASMVKRLTGIFYAVVAKQAIVSVQDPIVFPEHSELEPDIALLRPRDDYYSKSHPQAEDVLLIVEVADTSLRYDCEIKIPFYAAHKVPEVWLIDVENKQFTGFHTVASGCAYVESTPTTLASVAPRLLADMPLDLSSLF